MRFCWRNWCWQTRILAAFFPDFQDFESVSGQRRKCGIFLPMICCYVINDWWNRMRRATPPSQRTWQSNGDEYQADPANYLENHIFIARQIISLRSSMFWRLLCLLLNHRLQIEILQLRHFLALFSLKKVIR
jgi:hypothetical protein